VGRRDFDGPWHSAVLLEKQLASGRHEPHSRRPIRLRNESVRRPRQSLITNSRPLTGH